MKVTAEGVSDQKAIAPALMSTAGIVNTGHVLRHAVDRRIAKLVPTHSLLHTQPCDIFQDLEFGVAEGCQALMHARPCWEDAAHLVLPPKLVDDGFCEIHESATLGIHWTARFGEAACTLAHGRVCSQCRRVQFRIPAAQVYAIYVIR